ncbi:MAG: 16S rRNA pseudouridine(516) synthase [Clostridia bacterium]|nr:16S rRNA pseudouridine(516) synthase [Clostridia bacterium]
MRIDKLISEMGIASRKESSAVAKRGGVLVNGTPVRDLSTHIDPTRDKVTYLGRVIEYSKYVYVMLNKPEGYVSATEDSRLPVVTELLSEELQRMELFPVGRLDRDTVGLMLLTNNGPLAHSLLSPKKHVSKEYYFKCAEPLAPDAEACFRERITLADGYECKEALLVADEDRMGGVITLTEGKYHQIKRMIAATGNRVVYLERISFGGIKLDSTLARGEWRILTDAEKTLIGG